MSDGLRQRFNEGFWIPDESIQALLKLDSHCFVLYGLLGLCLSLANYPSTSVVATLLRLTEEQVWDLLQELYDSNLLNDSDVRAIHVACQKEEGHHDKTVN